jgi:phenylpropionate dioxygenase-like ring-hydroxylating dioxygenase large terminal subunit
LTLRSVSFEAPTLLVREAVQGYRFGPESRDGVGLQLSFSCELLDPYHLRIMAGGSTHPTAVTLLIQPVDQKTTIVHGRLEEKVGETDRIARLRHHNERMTLLREMVERNAPSGEALACY